MIDGVPCVAVRRDLGVTTAGYICLCMSLSRRDRNVGSDHRFRCRVELDRISVQPLSTTSF